MQLNLINAGLRKRLAIGLLLVVGLALLLAAFRYAGPEHRAEKPDLLLMTTLPLQWSEGGIEADLAANAAPHPFYERLQRLYDVRPIDDLNELPRPTTSILLLAQPRALAPTELVTLDRWVRDGGRLMILADPALQWGSLYPIGDKRRPLFTSLLSPLFSHWGIELVLPMTDEQPLSLQHIDGHSIRTQTPGEWAAKAGASSRACSIAPNKILAECRVGKGKAILVADADLLDSAYWQGRGVRAITGSDEFGNIEWIKDLLQHLTLKNHRKSSSGN